MERVELTERLIESKLAELDSARALITCDLVGSPLEALDTPVGGPLMKLESFLPTRSFKVRGALLAAAAASGRFGLTTASTGNFGAALAYAGDRYGVPVHVFATADAGELKRRRIAEMHGVIHSCEDLDDAVEQAHRFIDAAPMRYVSPYNDWHLILGAATIGLELSEQVGGRRPIVYCPVGGGGLICGIAAGLKSRRPDAEIVAVTPERSISLYNAVHGTARPNFATSLADGLVGGLESDAVTVGLSRRYVDRWVIVSEAEILSAMRLLFFGAATVSEGAGATSLAGFIADYQRETSELSVVVVSGANVEPTEFHRLMMISS